MPIRKYRSMKEMPEAPTPPPLDPHNLVLAFRLVELAERLSPIRRVPGVRRFRSLEEANAYRTAILRQAVSERDAKTS